MTAKELQAYESAWFVRYPTKRDDYEKYIEPYTYPTYMLFCAPVTNQILSFFRVITDVNSLDKLPVPDRVETQECTECLLPVTVRVDEKCLNCWSLDLDE